MQHIGKTFYREAQRSGEGVKGFVRGFRRGQKEVDRPCGNDGRVAGGWLTLSLSLSLFLSLSLRVSLAMTVALGVSFSAEINLIPASITPRFLLSEPP